MVDENHVVVAEEVGVPGGRVGSHGDAEEGLHLAGGSEGDEHAAGIGVASAKGVGDAAGTDDGFAGHELFTDITDLEGDFAFEDVEVLLLAEMNVQGWAAVNEVVVLDDEEAAVGFRGQGLEEHGAEAARTVFSEAVGACADGYLFRVESGG